MTVALGGGATVADLGGRPSGAFVVRVALGSGPSVAGLGGG